MNSIRRQMAADVYKYEEGLEDGWESFSKVICSGHTELSGLYTKEIEEDIICPYIKTSRGYIFIKQDDYIVTDEDGTRHVVSGEKVWNRYEKVAEN